MFALQKSVLQRGFYRGNGAGIIYIKNGHENNDRPLLNQIMVKYQTEGPVIYYFVLHRHP